MTSFESDIQIGFRKDEIIENPGREAHMNSSDTVGINKGPGDNGEPVFAIRRCRRYPIVRALKNEVDCTCVHDSSNEHIIIVRSIIMTGKRVFPHVLWPMPRDRFSFTSRAPSGGDSTVEIGGYFQVLFCVWMDA